MDQLLRSLLSANNETRTTAEQSLKSAVAQDPEAVLKEVVGMVSNADEGLSMMALVVLKQQFLDEAMGQVALKLDATQKEQLLTLLQENFQPETKKANYNRKILDLMAMLSNELGRAAELLQFLCGLSGPARTLGFYGIQILVERYLSDKFATENAQAFSEVLGAGLKADELETRVAALKAACEFLLAIEEDSVIMQFKAVLPVLVDTLIAALKDNQETGNEVLSSLIDLTQGHPEVWEGSQDDLVGVMAMIADPEADFDNGTRRQAVDLIVTLAEHCARLLRKSEAMANKFIPVLFQMLAVPEHGDDLEKWNQDLTEGEEAADLSKTDPHNVAKSAVAQVAFCLGEKAFMEMAAGHMQGGLKHENWRVRQACIMATGMCVDACKSSYKKNLKELVGALAGALEDSHPCVRYVGMTALSLICQNTSPKFQKLVGAGYLQKLWQVLNEDGFSKNRLHSVSAMIDFCRGVLLAGDEATDEDEETQEDDKEKLEASKSSNIIKSVAEDLLKAVVGALQKAMEEKFSKLQEELLNLLSLIASVIESAFLPYFSELTTAMQNLYESTPAATIEGQTLRGKVITTLGCMISALTSVRDENPQVMDFAQGFLTMLVGLKSKKNEIFKPEDPQIIAISQAYIHIAEFMQEDFAPFMPAVLGPLIEELSEEIDFTVESAEVESMSGGGASLKKNKEGHLVGSATMNLKGMEGPVKMSMKTFAFQQKEEAAKTVRSLCESLGSAMSEEVVAALLPVVAKFTTFQYSMIVQKSCIKTLKHFVKVPKDDATRAKFFTEQLYPILRGLLVHAGEKNNLLRCKLMFKEISSCVSEFSLNTEPLPFDKVTEIYEVMVKAFQGVNALNAQALSSISPTMDPEDQNLIMEEIDENMKVVSHIMDLSGALLKRYRDQLDDVLTSSGLIDLFTKPLGEKQLKASMLMDPLCFLGETMDYASVGMFQKLASTYIPRLFELLEAEAQDDIDLQQNIAYILGVVAHRATSAQFKPMAEMVSNKLISLITHPEAKEDDRIIATETFVGALGKVALFQISTLNEETVRNLYFSNLPLKAETEEALTAHDLLFEQIFAQSPVIENLKEDVQAVLQRMKTLMDSSDEEEGNELKDEIYTPDVIKKFTQAVGMLA